jgi:hypothetical protein
MGAVALQRPAGTPINEHHHGTTERLPHKSTEALWRPVPASPRTLQRLAAKGPDELAKALRRTWCKRWAVPGHYRCRLHGGASTGARTEAGRQKSFANLRQYRRASVPSP